MCIYFVSCQNDFGMVCCFVKIFQFDFSFCFVLVIDVVDCDIDIVFCMF